jgi:predicted permease
MKGLRRFARRLFASVLDRQGDERIRQEIAEHLTLATEEYVRAGLPLEEARRRARLELGAPEAIVERYRDEQRLRWTQDGWQDARFAVRWLRRSPGFTVAAVSILALGLGANIAVFAVINALLLAPLPFPNHERLMLAHLVFVDRQGTERETVWSYPKFATLASMQQVFDDVALFAARQYQISGAGDPAVVRGEIITETYLPVLGVAPVLGRSFTRDEAQRAGAEPVVLIGHGFWTRQYGADPGAIGQSLDINYVKHMIVGVLPRGFRGLSGNAELWTPLAVSEPGSLTAAQSHSFAVVARRRGDVSEGAAVAAVRAYGVQIEAAHRRGPAPARPPGATARSLDASRVDVDLQRVALVLMGAVACVLIITCANLTNLLVARSMARRREVAIRVALGAGRTRILRQFLLESLMLSAAGTVCGLAVAAALLAGAARLLPDSGVFFGTAIAPGTPRLAGAAGLTRVGAAAIGIDSTALAFSIAASFVTALLIGVLPALRASRLPPVGVIKAGGTSTARGFGIVESRSLLVGAEIAIALVLLVGAGLMLKSAQQLLHTAIGVDATNVLSAEVALPSVRYDTDSGTAFQEALVERLRTAPGIDAVGWGYCLPVSGGCNGTIISFPPTPQADTRTEVGIGWATAGYFDAFHIPVLEGRNFTDADRRGRPKVALVDETAARAFWPGQSAIGKRIAVGQGGFGGDGAEVIGVIGNVRYETIDSPSGPHVFLPLAQSYQDWMQIVVRSRLASQDTIAVIRREVRALDPSLPLNDVKTMDTRVDDAMWRTRVSAWLLSAFALLALVLTAVGIFGVMSQIIAQRTSEIGIRMALGASRADVLQLVLSRASSVTLLGVAGGLAAAIALTRVLRTLLYEVTPTDPSTLVAAALVLGAVSLLACYIPARRALDVDPLTALRSE